MDHKKIRFLSQLASAGAITGFAIFALLLLWYFSQQHWQLIAALISAAGLMVGLAYVSEELKKLHDTERDHKATRYLSNLKP